MSRLYTCRSRSARAPTVSCRKDDLRAAIGSPSADHSRFPAMEGLPGSVRDHEDELSLAELTQSQVKISGAFPRVRRRVGRSAVSAKFLSRATGPGNTGRWVLQVGGWVAMIGGAGRDPRGRGDVGQQPHTRQSARRGWVPLRRPPLWRTCIAGCPRCAVGPACPQSLPRERSGCPLQRPRSAAIARDGRREPRSPGVPPGDR
jgi:hypothetical protein